MANFEKNKKNVHGLTLQVQSKGVFELGLWGPVDTRTGTELVVTLKPPRPEATVTRAGMAHGKEPVRIWQFSGLPIGHTLVEAKDSGGVAWTSVTLDVFENAGKHYTTNAHEVPTRHTNPAIGSVVYNARVIWGSLTERGGRTLAAQYVQETGNGEQCYNFNLGNIKSYNASLPHMYLNPVWECVAAAHVEKVLGSSLAREATEPEKKKWPCPGKTTIVFTPPHQECRFRAYSNLYDGTKDWVEKHMKIYRDNSQYLDLINAGDTDAVASAMKRAHYYSGNEGLYQQGMKRAKIKIDQTLGDSDSLAGY